jgi:hypothetical protein
MKKPDINRGGGKKNSLVSRKTCCWLLVSQLLLVCLPGQAQTPAPGNPSIGEVEQLRGAGFAQAAGQLPRILGRGLALNEGDRLTTADNALAIIRLNDGTKMTLRPGTELVLSQYAYKTNSDSNAMVLQLLRGGLRALTGLISKASPNAAKIQTSTATIGIRGTDFDARLCKTGECSSTPAAGNSSTIAVSARVLRQQGQLTAIDEQGQRRVLSPGAGIYPGDVLETASNATALLAFRDESKISLGASTRFRIDDFSFDATDVTTSRYFMSLLRGSLRAVTGLIGNANRQNVRFKTNTATVGIRGTEFAMDCTGACASSVPTKGTGDAGDSGDNGDAGADGDPTSGLTLFTFKGVLVVALTLPNPSGSSDPIELVAGRGLVAPGQVGLSGVPQFEFLNVPPSQLLTDSPDGVTIPPGTFSRVGGSDAQEGLFVFVRDGDVSITTVNQQINLGRNEAGFTGANLNVLRLQTIPEHILRDSVPLPTSLNINVSGLRPPQNNDQVCPR